jgi:hypothetical protein
MEIQPSLRNWPRLRVTVSRVVQVIDARSSCVSRNGKRYSPDSAVLADLMRQRDEGLAPGASDRNWLKRRAFFVRTGIPTGCDGHHRPPRQQNLNLTCML